MNNLVDEEKETTFALADSKNGNRRLWAGK